MGVARGFLPDVNVWLAVTFEQHVHHIAARTWFESHRDPVAFCSLTLLGLLRLSTHPKVLGNEALTMRQAWNVVDQFLSDPRIERHAEPSDLDPAWRQWTRRNSKSHRLWADAYLAAFATTTGQQLVTFDRGFTSFKDLETVVLS